MELRTRLRVTLLAAGSLLALSAAVNASASVQRTAVSAGSAQVATPRQLPQTVPSGLNPGDKYRLVFVTSTGRDATSSDIEDYNLFAQETAELEPALLALDTRWSVIGSTATTPARENTGITSLGAPPVYRLDGQRVVSDAIGLWAAHAGTPLENPVSLNESGILETSNSVVFTGSDPNGNPSGRPLGDPDKCTRGNLTSQTGPWLFTGTKPSTELHHFYVISDVLTVLSTASTGQVTEDFTTTDFMDPAETTADWDTAAGELKLNLFVPAIVGTHQPVVSEASAIVVAGDFAILANGNAGIEIVDISDPASPSLLGVGNSGDIANDVAVAGDIAFVAYGTGGLQAYDISDLTNPSSIGANFILTGARGIALTGDHAFVADTFGGLVVMDVSDPTNPTLAGSYASPGLSYDVAISGNYAFLADGLPGLQVVDITDPASPTFVANYDAGANVYDVEVSGNYAFLAASGSGLVILDITDPTNPTLAGSYDTTGTARGVTVSDNVAYISDGADGLKAIDISDPTLPSLIYAVDTPGDAHNAAVAGEHAYVADDTTGLQVIAARSVISPVEVSSLAERVSDLAISGDHVFIVDNGGSVSSNGQLRVIDISDPSTPISVGNVSVPGATGIAVSGNTAYVPSAEDGFTTCDITDPTNPSVLDNFYRTDCDFWDVKVSGDFAFTVGVDFDVFDVSDPTAITNPFTLSLPYGADCLEISGNYAYIVDFVAGLQVFDISDPTNPILVGSYSPPGIGLWVAISGDLAMLGDVDNGVYLLDVSDPTSPMYVGTYSVTGDPSVRNVVISGDLAFCSISDNPAQRSNVDVIDISDPANPSLVHSYELPDAWSPQAYLSGNLLFLGTANGGVAGPLLQVTRVYDHVSLGNSTIGQSRALAAPFPAIQSVSLLATQTGDVAWEVSADGALNWQAVPADGTLTNVTFPGNDLRWRATLTQGATLPTVSSVQIQY